MASAAKVFYSHLLFKAVEDGRIESLDEKAVRWEPRLQNLNKSLGFKDAEITWRLFATRSIGLHSVPVQSVATSPLYQRSALASHIEFVAFWQNRY